MYTHAVIFFLFICTLLHGYSWTRMRSFTDSAGFHHFQSLYLTVYSMAVLADWLQGPYVYALYEDYGVAKHDIEYLFVVGFASSMIFGTFIGGLADKTGRRSSAIIYGVFYGVSCITKHFNNLALLMLGRVFAGIATSILYSVFESWLICENTRRGYSSDQLGATLAYQYLVNSITAIFAGFVAQYAVSLSGSYVTAFDVALFVLAVMVIIVTFKWSENYGDSDAQVSASFTRAICYLRTDLRIPLLAAIQSVFEGAMYIFVLEWTPALERATLIVATEAEDNQKQDANLARELIPFGIVFSSYMVCTMIGSAVFRLVDRVATAECYMIVVFFIAALSFLPVLITPNIPAFVFGGFCVFEMCVGIFWPSIGVLRSRYIPEEARSTLMNFFRIPLNLIVVLVLLQNLALNTLFGMCVILVFCAVFLQVFFCFYNRSERLSAEAAAKLCDA